jgi:N-dimethylarginine dimethylaminohydrolase
MANAVKMFKSIAMCAPNHFKVAYKINPWMGGTVDSALAHKQWNTLKNAFEKNGVEVKTINQAEGLPDMVFCCNSGIVYGKKVYLAHFRHPERQGERDHYEKWFRENGYEVFGDKDSFFEGGGDATFTSPDKLWAGYGFRSQKEVYAKIQKLGNFKIIPCELNNDKFYHLDVCFCPLSDKLALWYPNAFTKETQERMKKEIELIEVTEKDAQNFVCNAVAVGDTVFLPKNCVDIVPTLKSRGFKTVEIDLSEFLKAGGAIQCLVLKL